MKNLNESELKSINGGGFGFDVGWLVGNLIAGNFSINDPNGYAHAVGGYAEYYSK